MREARWFPYANGARPRRRRAAGGQGDCRRTRHDRGEGCLRAGAKGFDAVERRSCPKRRTTTPPPTSRDPPAYDEIGQRAAGRGVSRVALLDVNLLVALFDPDHIHHELAHDWFADHRPYGRARWSH